MGFTATSHPPIRFRVTPTPELVAGRLVYREKEFSWDFQADDLVPGSWSLEWGPLQIEVSAEGQLLYIWGYHPWHRWLTDEASRVPAMRSARLEIDVDDDAVPGTSLRLCSLDEVVTVVDRVHGVVRVSCRSRAGGEAVYEFADGVAVEMDASGQIVAVWLRPADGLPLPAPEADHP